MKKHLLIILGILLFVSYLSVAAQGISEEAFPTGSYLEQVLNKIGDRILNYGVTLVVAFVVFLTIGALLVGVRSNRKIVKILLIVVGVIGVFILLTLLYNFFVLGQKDFGLKYQYSYCENNIYYIYPRGVLDGSNAYYNKDRELVGMCHSFTGGENCEEVRELAGKCKMRGFQLFIPFI